MARRHASPPSQLLLYLRGEGVAPNGEPELKRVLSYGAGADSFALLCAAYEYRLLYGRPLLDHVVFADTGDPERKFPGEWPETYAHILRVAQPLAAAAGVPFKWITGDDYPVRDARSLYEWIIARQMMPSVHPKHRLCTIVAKIERVEAFTADLWPAPTRIETWIGLESGEESRLLNDPYAKGSGDPRRSKRYPLMDWGLCRCRLSAYVRRLGLPVPPKSACMFCLAGETKVVTRQGVRPIAELAGQRHELLVPQVGTKGGLAHRGSFQEVEVRSFGVQPLWEVKLRRGQSRKTVRATAEHRWFLAAGPGAWKEASSYERTTASLMPGDRLRTLRATAPAREAIMPVAVAHRTRGGRSRKEYDRCWTVESVRPLGVEEEVFCAVVPGAQAFGLADDLMTGNCPANSKGDFQRLLAEHPARFEQAVFIEKNAKLSRAGVRLRLAGNQKYDEDLRDWVERDYRARPPRCKVCGAQTREEKLVGAGGDPLPPGGAPVPIPPPPSFRVRDLVTGEVSLALGHSWAVGLPEGADPTVPAVVEGPDPADALKSVVRYAGAGGAARVASLRPTSATVWAGRPMLLARPDGLLHASVVLDG